MPPPGINKTKEEIVVLLRTFMGDTKEENKLIPGEELSNDKLSLAVDLCIDEFNNQPPFTQFNVKSFPSLMVIIHGSVVHALIMAGLVQARNYLQFSDGGISEVLSDKSPSYQGWINAMTNTIRSYKATSDAIKVSINMEQGFGVIASPYGRFSDGNGSF
jgi:hypothetical protein